VLVKGMGGAFVVRVGGEVVFSKKLAGRFPEPGEVESLLEPKLAV
jgi:selT/selW/selH-like putative selenoprotein